MMLRRSTLKLSVFFLAASLANCDRQAPTHQGKLVIGIVAYGEQSRSLDRYAQFNEYLARATQSLIELEPVFNERKAMDQLRNQSWSLVFAPPGLAAIAIDRYQYIPLFPTQGVSILRSVLIVRKDSPLQTLGSVAGKKAALGQQGSATGYYLPLYDLYGLTLAEIQLTPTPKAILEAVNSKAVDVGAVSQEDYEQFRSQFPPNTFRILHTSRPIPGGAVLLGPSVERNQQAVITQAMNAAPPNLAQDASFIPNAKVADYQYLIELIRKVKPIEVHLSEKPAQLFSK